MKLYVFLVNDDSEDFDEEEAVSYLSGISVDTLEATVPEVEDFGGLISKILEANLWREEKKA